MDTVRQLTVFRDQILGGFEKTLERYGQDVLPNELQRQLQLTREIRDSLISLLAANNVARCPGKVLKVTI